MRRLVLLAVPLVLTVGVAGVLLFAKGETQEAIREVSEPDPIDEAYASIESPEFTLYWLGPTPTFDGMAMAGPDVCKIGCHLENDGIESYYRTPRGDTILFSLTSLSPTDSWPGPFWLRGRNSNHRVDRLETFVGGRPATFSILYDANINVRYVVVSVKMDSRTVVTMGWDNFRSQPRADVLLRAMEQVEAFPVTDTKHQ
jgi:hypothetical protein